MFPFQKIVLLIVSSTFAMQDHFSLLFFFPLLVVKANPEFREKVNAILKRSNSTLGRLSVSRDSTSTSHIEVSFHGVGLSPLLGFG